MSTCKHLISTPSLFYLDLPTSAQLGILFFLLTLLLPIVGLSGAPVALPLQHVADHHPQQAQKEENRHQDERNVVRVARPSCFTVTFSSSSLIPWRTKRDEGEIIIYY